MSNERYIAAIEISSSKIIGTVGRLLPDKSLEVIAVEQEKMTDCVRYGIIQNLEETYMRIARVIRNLEMRPVVAPRKIAGVYIGISGRSMRSIVSEVNMTLSDDTEITKEIVERLRQQALRSAIDSTLEVVDAVPRSFIVGNSTTLSPVGRIGNSISATFDLVVCRPELKRNIERTVVEKLNLPVLGYVVTPMATGYVILSTDEKRLGCMLVDMGAETTAVSLYRQGHLCYYATLPMGSRNITRDLTSLNILDEKAEEIKINSGNAMPSASGSSYNIDGVKISDVNSVIAARSEEIVENFV